VKNKFFEWVAEVCKELGWEIKEGAKLMPSEDPSWWFCYDDGMTPKEAVAEAVKHGVVKPVEFELKA